MHNKAAPDTLDFFRNQLDWAQRICHRKERLAKFDEIVTRMRQASHSEETIQALLKEMKIKV